jgi:FKBP-type peptidyl-prolyl cis-trans isomerase 2
MRGNIMAQAKQGDTVKVHYIGKLQDGTVFDSSENRDPLQLTLGEGQVISGFEDTIIGMNPGESKTIDVSSEKAYGPYRDEMVVAIAREQFPEHLSVKVNQQLEVVQENGQTLVVRVADVSESTVTLDANHPLAGEDLTFDIQLIEVI